MSLTVCRRALIDTLKLYGKQCAVKSICIQYIRNPHYVIRNVSCTSMLTGTDAVQFHRMENKQKIPAKKESLDFTLRNSPEVQHLLQSPDIDFLNVQKVCIELLKENYEQGSQKVWQITCARYIHGERRVDQAIRFFHFLKQLDPKEIQPSAYALLMGTFRGTGRKYEHIIYEIYETLQNISKIFPMGILCYILEGLCETEMWKKSLELLDIEREFSQTASIAARAPIISAAIRAGERDIVDSLLTDILVSSNQGQTYKIEMLQQYLFDIVKDENVQFTMKEYLDILGMLRFYPNIDLSDDIKKYFRSELTGWTCVETETKNRDYCKSCSYKFPEATIAREEFVELQQQIMDKLILTSDVYLNTNPEEVKNFIKLVEKHGPFDVVLDGCNIALNKKYPGGLEPAVNYFAKDSNKILLVCRNHLMHLKRMDQIKKKAVVWSVDNKSKDDPFIMYAFCQSPNTYLVSKDYMRNHMSLIDSHLHKTYLKWLESRQIKEFAFGKNIARAQIPPAYDLVPSYDDNSYHIPFLRNGKHYWLCARRKED